MAVLTAPCPRCGQRNALDARVCEHCALALVKQIVERLLDRVKA